MAATHFKSVDEYIAAQPETSQTALNRLRGCIRAVLPGAEETILYNLPAYKLQGVWVIWFAGWRQHYTLYPASDRVMAAFQDELAPYKVDKSTIRFPLSEPVPCELIERIAKLRAEEVYERKKAKEAAPKRR